MVRPSVVFASIVLVYSGTLVGVCGYLAPIAARLPLNGTIPPPGSPWPEPESSSPGSQLFASIQGRDFRFIPNVSNCPILNRAIERYNANLLFRDLDVTPTPSTRVLVEVSVQIPEQVETNLCNEYPKLYTEADRNYERYEIVVTESTSNEDEATATIKGMTVWGALHGIETFSQLMWWNMDMKEPHFNVNYTTITDAPRYPFRGLMLDTARHYVDLPVIQDVLDGMAYNKLNVFHWHIVDDQSFPFVSREFPELSREGAYLPELTYEPEEVQQIIEYARDRAIRVILEFDTPGHTRGFGKAFPWLLTPCYGDIVNPGTPNWGVHADYEILDPSNETTFTFLREFFSEVKSVSRDEYVHLGMDEAYVACWDSSPVIKAFMAAQNISNTKQLENYYSKRHTEMIEDIGLKSIIWNDAVTRLNDSFEPSRDVIIQVWEGGNPEGPASNAWISHWKKSLGLQHKSILSSCWYLNYIYYAGANSREFRKYYECDPIVQLMPNVNPEDEVTEEERALVLGGEACLWGEYADGTNFLTRIFPLVGAMAERLWSSESHLNISKEASDNAWHRLDQHRCRMMWRGIGAQPVYNGYCFPQEKTGFRMPDPTTTTTTPTPPTTTPNSSTRPAVASLAITILASLSFLFVKA